MPRTSARAISRQRLRPQTPVATLFNFPCHAPTHHRSLSLSLSCARTHTASQPVERPRPSSLPARTKRDPEKVLESLDERYYDPDFAALEEELTSLPADVSTRELDAKCVGLMKHREALEEILCARVLANYEQFIDGMSQVTNLQHDLTMANVVVRNARRFTRRAAAGTEGALGVVENSRRKRRLLETLALATEVRDALRQRELLREALDRGKYAAAMAGAIECRETLGELAERGVGGPCTTEGANADGGSDVNGAGTADEDDDGGGASSSGSSGIEALREAREKLDEVAGEAVTQADAQLQSQCTVAFDEGAYRDVLYVYMLLEDELGLVDKVQTFAQQDVLAKSQNVLAKFATRNDSAGTAAAAAVRGGGQVAFIELCRGVPEDDFQQCLSETMTSLFEVLCVYHRMLAWHLQKVAAQVEVPTNATDDSSSADGADEEQASAAEAAAMHEREACAVIAAALKRGRRTVWDLAARRVAALLSADTLAASGSEAYMQVIEWTSSFIQAGEAFCGSEAGTLRSRLQQQTVKYFGAQHRRSMGVLKDIVTKEAWTPLPLEALEAYRRSARAYLSANAAQTKVADLSKQNDFEAFVAAGPVQLFTRADNEGEEDGAPGPVPASPGDATDVGGLGRRSSSVVGGKPAGAAAKSSDEALRRAIVEEGDEVDTGGRGSARPSNGKDGDALSARKAPTLTAAGLRIVDSWERYIALMALLPAIAGQIFRGAAEMYELYMLSIFQLFGKREALAREGLGADTSDAQALLTPRLRTALLRIARERGIDVTQWAAPRKSTLSSNGAPMAAVGVVATDRASASQAQQQMKSSASSMMGRLGARLDKLTKTPPKLTRSKSGGGGGMPGETQPSAAAMAPISGNVPRTATAPAMQQCAPDGDTGSAGSQDATASRRGLAFAEGSGGGNAPPTPPGAGPPTPGAESPSSLARVDAILSSGNLYGLKERYIATESLYWVAEEIKGMRARLISLLSPADARSAEHFFSRTVDAAGDLREHVCTSCQPSWTAHSAPISARCFARALAWRTPSYTHTYMRCADGTGRATHLGPNCADKSVSRLLLNSASFAHAVSAARFDAKEVGDSHSTYVDVILNSFRQFATKVSVAGVTPEVADVLFNDAVAATAEALVEGYAQARKCTNEGRALMSLDVQTLIAGLRDLRKGAPPPNLDMVSEYIRAFYLPMEDVLGWAARHPEYKVSQVVALVKSAADAQGWKRSDRKALIERIEAGELI